MANKHSLELQAFLDAKARAIKEMRFKEALLDKLERIIALLERKEKREGSLDL